MKRFITIQETLRRVAMSRTQLYRLIGEGTFPKQIPLGVYRIAFLEDEVEAWMAKRLDARDLGEGLAERQRRAMASVKSKKVQS